MRLLNNHIISLLVYSVDLLILDKHRNKYITVLNELGVDRKNCKKLIIDIDGKWIRKSTV